jgi:hypothetical protein
MKIRTWATVTLFALSAALRLAAADGDDKAKKKAAEEAAMMEAWMKTMNPSDGHKKLEPMVGTFKTKMASWMAPDAPPIYSDGESVNTWALGGRFIEQRFKGTYMEQPFEGIGFTGYDNVGKKYVGSWMDSMGTGIMNSEGSVEKDGKTFKFTASMLDPMTGKEQKMKEEITVHSNDSHVLEMWAPGPDGKMFRMMEIVYTRK